MSLHNLKIVDLTKIIKHKQTTNKTYSRKYTIHLQPWPECLG